MNEMQRRSPSRPRVHALPTRYASLSGNVHTIFVFARQHDFSRGVFFQSSASGKVYGPIRLTRAHNSRREPMSRNANLTRWMGAALLLALSSACSKKNNSATDTAAVAVVPADTTAAVAVTAAPGGPVSLTVATKPGVGVYLTDASGRAVY